MSCVFEPVDGEPIEVELRGVAEQLRHNQQGQTDGERLVGDALTAAAMAEVFARSSGNDKHNPDAPTVVINVPEDHLADFLAQHPDVIFEEDDAESSGDRSPCSGDGPAGVEQSANDTTTERHVHVRRHAGPRCGCGRPPRPALINGQPMTRNQMRRFLCDSLLVAVVVASDGAILRLGRVKRTATKTQRLYLALRDGGCTFPGCSAPAYGAVRTTSSGGATTARPTSTTCASSATSTTRRSMTAAGP